MDVPTNHVVRGQIVQTFKPRIAGLDIEIVPDYGCFTIAWTSYGIVAIDQHVFGIRPDAGIRRSCSSLTFCRLGEHQYRGPAVGANLISFSRTRTGKGSSTILKPRENGWSFVLREKASPNTRYFLTANRPILRFPESVWREEEPGANQLRALA